MVIDDKSISIDSELERMASFPILNPQPITETNTEGQILFMNPTAARLFPDLEKTGENHPWLKDWNKLMLLCKRDERKTCGHEVKVGNRWYYQTFYLLRKEKRLRIYGVDITVSKELENNLKASERKYKGLFMYMINGCAYHEILTDSNGKPVDYKFLEVNSAFEKMTGLAAANVVGKKVTEVIPGIENDPVDWIGRYGKVALTGGTDVFENYSAGLGKWYNVSVFSPEKGYFAVIFEDITKRKQFEERLKELDRLKDEFLSVTTHELKTPLIPIKSQSQLLLDGDYGELNLKQKRAIEMILRNAESLNLLSGEVLDIAKIKSKKLKLILDEGNIEKVIANAVKNVKNFAEEKSIVVKLSVESGLPKVMFDELRIGQVISNLLDNAIKFTPENGKIWVEVKKMNKMIKVIVKDTGVGISKENIKKLFVPFFQVDSSVSRKYRGTGLGLAVSKGFIEEHKGKIWVESDGEGKGSSFIFTVPIELSIKNKNNDR